MHASQASPRSAHGAVAPGLTRGLLRHLRDLNLFTRHIALTSVRSVSIEGCLSSGSPVEEGVRYRLLLDDGSERTLEIRADGAGLGLTVAGPGVGSRKIAAELRGDAAGRVVATRLAARAEPAQPRRRELEHFMRRVVRGVLGPGCDGRRAVGLFELE